MDYIEFRAKLVERITSMTTEGEEVRLSQVNKNNGIVLDGLNVRIPGCNVGPTLYVEEIKERFDRMKSGSEEEILSEIAKEILGICREKAAANTELAEKLMDYGNLRDKICFRLINRERNRVRLQDMPFRPVLDLAMIYYYSTDTICGLHGTIQLKNTDLERWGIAESELFRDAMHNTPLLEPLLSKPMIEDDEEFGLRIFTNQSFVNGAAVMFYEGAFSEYAEKWQRDLIILPSSIHEVLALPDTGLRSMQEMRNMVREVNATVVEDTEVLSDEVYVWEYGSREIRIA